MDLTVSPEEAAGFNRPPRWKLPFDGALHIRAEGNRYIAFGVAPPLFALPEFYVATLALSVDEAIGAVNGLLATWHDKVVYREAQQGRLVSKTVLPFQTAVKDRAAMKLILQEAGRSIAVAGSKLYWQMFGGGDPELVKLRERLEWGLRSGPLRIRVISSDCVVPWQLLYTHPDADEPLEPDGRNFKWEGFWGLRHVIDQEIAKAKGDVPLVPDNQNKLPTGVYYDQDALANISMAIQWFTKLCRLEYLEVAVNSRKAELADTLADSRFGFQALYVLCHGVENPQSAEPGFRLSDGEAITGSDIGFWLKGKHLPTEPLVFLNSCKGGLVRTQFFRTAAAGFLGANAAGVVGPYTDVPTAFATQLAFDFFTGFAKNGDEAIFVGPLLRQLSLKYLKDDCNPIGMTYACYRAAGCYVDWPDSRATLASGAS